jgi:tryptophan 2,3-dioxygenase
MTGYPVWADGVDSASTFSDDQRRQQADETGGCPWTSFPAGNTPYVEYAAMDALLSLRQPRTSAPTEPGFIILSQVKELLFDLLHTELTGVREQIRQDRLSEALWTLRRAHRVQTLLIGCWDVLGALSPTEFAEFRDVLGRASGFQSVSYRKLEFLMGNKNPAMVVPHENAPQYESVRAQLAEPSLYDEVIALLHRWVKALPPEVIDRDVAAPYEPHAAVEAAWRVVYTQRDRYAELYLLAEALTDSAAIFARWRYTHLVTVQRIIGDKPGSGGTSGVSWLRGIAEHRFFPELWTVRSTL